MIIDRQPESNSLITQGSLVVSQSPKKSDQREQKVAAVNPNIQGSQMTEIIEETGDLSDFQISSDPNANPLILVIFENCLNRNHKSHETGYARAVRIALKIMTFGFSIAGSVPNIAVGLKFGGKNRALGYSVVVSNFTSRTSLCTWSYHHIIDGELGSEGAIKKQIERQTQAWYTKAILVTGVFSVALIAQTPQAYIAYFYNKKKILYPILDYMALTAFPAFSLYLSAQSLLEKNRFSPFEALMNKIKTDLEAKIQHCRSKLISLSPQERADLLKQMFPLENQATQEDIQNKVIHFISKVSTEGNLPPEERTCMQKVKKVSSKAFGHLFALATSAAQLAYYYQISVAASHVISKHPAFAYATGALVIASNVQLTTQIMFKFSHKLSNQMFYNPLRFLIGEGVSATLRPKIRSIIELGVLGISCLSIGTIVQPIRDNFKGEYYSLMVIMAPLSTLILKRNALNDFVEEISTAAILAQGKSVEETELILLDRSLNKLDYIIKHTSFKNLAKFLVSLPDDVYKDLVKVDITKEKLSSYIDIS